MTGADDFDHIADGSLGGAPVWIPDAPAPLPPVTRAPIPRPMSQPAVEIPVHASDPTGRKSLDDLALYWRALGVGDRLEGPTSDCLADWLRLRDLERALKLAGEWKLQFIGTWQRDEVLDGAFCIATDPTSPKDTIQFPLDSGWSLTDAAVYLAERIRERERQGGPKTCGQDGCDAPAAFSHIWPGHDGPAYVCLAHASWLREVATAVGMPGHVLTPVVPDPSGATQ